MCGRGGEGERVSVCGGGIFGESAAEPTFLVACVSTSPLPCACSYRRNHCSFRPGWSALGQCTCGPLATQALPGLPCLLTTACCARHAALLQVVRGHPAFMLSVLLCYLDPLLRSTAGVGSWQVGRGRGVALRPATPGAVACGGRGVLPSWHGLPAPSAGTHPPHMYIMPTPPYWLAPSLAGGEPGGGRGSG